MVVLDNPDKKRMCDELLKELRERQYAEVPFALSPEECQRAARHFFNFLALSQERKNQFYIQPTDDPRDSGIGYVRKRQEDGEYDNKEYVHYHPSVLKQYFADLLAEEEPAVTAFFNSARTMFNEAEHTLRKVVAALEVAYPSLGAELFPLDEKRGSVLRFLKYDVAGAGKFLAAGHYDMGACTLALAESAPGLRLGRDDETLTPVSRSGSSAFFMTGLNFPPLTGNAFFPTWHDVVQESDDTWNDDTARWAVVFFVGARNLPFPSYKATHRPLSKR